jgi:DNA polymerase/3'-5' exonuclease PolX
MKTKVPLHVARTFAEQFVAELAPACHRIEIAGSIRRKKSEVGDIELIAIPKQRLNLLMEPMVDTELDLLLYDSGYELTKNGPKYKQILTMLEGMTVDLFIADALNWGYIMMLRTGPWEYSRDMVTARIKGGMKPNHLTCSDGYVWRDGGVVPLPDEESFYTAWGLSWLEPEKRR